MFPKPSGEISVVKDFTLKHPWCAEEAKRRLSYCLLGKKMVG